MSILVFTIPLKPIIIKINIIIVFGQLQGDDIILSICPKCKLEVPQNEEIPFVFCPRCGKKLSDSEKRRAGRVGNGQGSVYKRAGRKTYEAAITVDLYTIERDGSTKLVQKRMSKGGFKTKKEAWAYIPVLRDSARDRPGIKDDVTFLQLYNHWEKTHEKNVSHSTMNCYKAAMQHFKPVWFSKLSTLRTSDFQTCIDQVSGRQTQKNMRCLCGQMYKLALCDDIVQKDYSSFLVVNGTVGEKRQPFTKKELEKMWKIVSDPNFDCENDITDVILILCYTGFRISEFLELRVSDLHENEDGLTYLIGGKKTEAGRNRKVPVSAKILPLIKRRMEGNQNYIFSLNDKKPMDPGTFRKNYFYPSLERHGLRGDKTPHSCRHTYATLLKDINVADKDKLSAIGHTSVSMLMHYTHSDNAGLIKIAEGL